MSTPFLNVPRSRLMIPPHLVSRGINDAAVNEAEELYRSVSVGDATFANEGSRMVAAHFGAGIKVVFKSFQAMHSLPFVLGSTLIRYSCWISSRFTLQ